MTPVYVLFHKLAGSLLEKEVLNYADVETLLGPPTFGKKRLVDIDNFDEMEIMDKEERDVEQTERKEPGEENGDDEDKLRWISS